MQKKKKDRKTILKFQKLCVTYVTVCKMLLTSHVLSHHSLVKDEKSSDFAAFVKVLGLYFMIFYRGLACLTANTFKSI